MNLGLADGPPVDNKAAPGVQQSGVTMRDGKVEESVVSMSMYRGGLQFPLIKEVEAYWQALRGERVVPLRSDIDPRGIERALEYAFVIERIAPGMARFRLAGMHLNDLMGMEVRGMPLTSFFTPDCRKRIGEALEQLFEGPQTVEVLMSAETGIGKPPLEAKLLLLPLKSDLGDISRALGCLVSIGQIGRTPRRFNVVESRITALRPPAEEARSPEAADPPVVTRGDVPGFAEAQAGFDYPEEEEVLTRRRPNLRLVSDNSEPQGGL